jgi:hypothetical protein
VVSFTIQAKKFKPGSVLLAQNAVLSQLILIKRGQVGVRKMLSQDPFVEV